MKISLKAARINAGLRQTDVAVKLGKTRDAIQYLETKGAEHITYNELLDLCDIYGCTPDDISLPKTTA